MQEVGVVPQRSHAHVRYIAPGDVQRDERGEAGQQVHTRIRDVLAVAQVDVGKLLFAGKVRVMRGDERGEEGDERGHGWR